MRSPVVYLTLALLCVVPAADARAQARTQGSPLTAAANYAYGCETRWAPGGAGSISYEPTPIGPSTCTIWQAGTTTDDTFLVPDTGTVLSARIKAGDNPPQVQIATIRRYFNYGSSGGLEYTCCRGISVTPPVQLEANKVNEIPVNLVVSVQQPDRDKGTTGWWDIVAVNVLTPGNLPMADLGPHPFGATFSNTPAAYWYFPAVVPDANNQNEWSAPNFEVLMQFDWCPKVAGTRGYRASCPTAPATAPPTTPPAPTTPAGPTVQPPSAAGVTSTKLKLLGGRVGVGVKCNQVTTCAATVRLRTLGRKLLGTKKATVRPGRSATVKVPLSRLNRKRVTKKGIKVIAEVDLGGATKITKTLVLKR